MHSALPGHDDTVATQGYLGNDIGALGILGTHRGDLLVQWGFVVGRLQRGEEEFLAEAVKQTFSGLMEANRAERKAAPLSKLILGLECGGSDGFSGISSNPVMGHVADLCTAAL